MTEQAFRFEIFDNAAAFDRLEAGWESLCRELSGSITVFASNTWYRNWWKYYSSGATLHLFTMLQGDKLVGVAPLMKKKSSFHGLSARTVGFIENNQSLHNEFIVKPEFRNLFLQNLLASLYDQHSSWDVLYFRNISSLSDTYKTLTNVLETGERRWNKKNTPFDTPYLIPSSSWSDYFAGRTRRNRKTLKNIRNRMLKTGEVSIQNIRTKAEFLSRKEEIFNLAKLSWTENVGDSLGSPANRDFYDSLASSAAENGWLSVWVLYLNGTMIALEFHLRAYGREHALRGHYHPEFASLSPGTYLEMAILEHIFSEQEKVQIYDLCGAFDTYKKKWTDTYVPHCDILIFKEQMYSRYIMFHEFKLVPFVRHTLQRVKLLD